MKVLHLTLKKKWFDMIASGEKKEEYREIKPFWITRFCKPKHYMEPQVWHEFSCDLIHQSNNLKRRHRNYNELFDYFEIKAPVFDFVVFKNGYSKNSPIVKLKVFEQYIGKGNPDWGAESGKEYFVIKLGDIITSNKK